MSKCLYCHTKIMASTSWSDLLVVPSEKHLCNDCLLKLELILGETCNICHRPFSGKDITYHKGDRCYDCIRWESEPEWQGTLQKNISLYMYNDFLKELIAQFKFRGDYILAKVFSEPLRKMTQKLQYDLIIPIPLSEQRLYERGFNQATALLIEAKLPYHDILSRTHSEKQSKKSRNERIHIEQVFQLNTTQPLTNKHILLIDDIYTTGSTLRHAAKLLKQAGAQVISSLTLARG